MNTSEKYQVRFGFDPSWLKEALEVYNKTDMKRDNAEQVRKAFSNSQVVISVWFDNRLIGLGRMITDFEMYSAIFDVVVDPAFQKNGIGKIIMDSLISKAPQTCIHLTSTFGNEKFYYKLGFRSHKTAMALYPESFGKSGYLNWD